MVDRGGGPFGSRFLGAIDFSRVGTMGHSKGGEGVLRDLQVNAASAHPYGIRAVLALAPSFERRFAVRGVAFAYLIGTCDHDTGPAGVKTYDASRYAMPDDPVPKYTVFVTGANHNYFNTTWSPSGGLGGQDDWSSVDPKTAGCAPGAPTRLTEDQQRATATAYIVSFFRYHLGGENQFAPVWQGREEPPPSFGPAQVSISYQAPATMRRDVNRLLVGADLKRDALGGAVTLTGFDAAGLCGGAPPQPLGCLSTPSNIDDLRQPHQEFGGKGTGLSVLKLSWSRPGARFDNALPPAGRDLGGFADLRFRAAVDFTDRRNPVGRPQDLTVRLVDGAGRTASVHVAPYTHALDYPARLDTWAEHREVRYFLMRQARVPLCDLTGIDLHDVRTVSLVFDATPHGSVGLTDLAFTR